MFGIATDIHVVQADTLRVDPDWKWDQTGNNTNQFLFWIITGGRGTIVSGDEEFSLKRGDCFIFRMWEPQTGRQVSNNLLEIPWLVFEYIDHLKQKIYRPDPLPKKKWQVNSFGFIEQLAQRAIESFKTEGGEISNVAHWLKSALLEVRRQDNTPKIKSAQKESFDKVEDLAETIRDHPEKRYCVEKMAYGMNCSPDHFIRLFKKFIGITPIEHVIRCKMDRAGSLLLFTGLNIGEIAEILGYTDVVFFSRQFKSRNGISPLKYRNGLLPNNFGKGG